MPLTPDPSTHPHPPHTPTPLALPPGAVLGEGKHGSRREGSCALEWADYLDRTRRGLAVADDACLTDAPECVCPALRGFVVTWNDALPTDSDRTRLLGPIVPRLLDTRSTPAVETRRRWLAADWLVRTYTPTWLDAAGLTEHAAALRGLAEITDLETLAAAQPALDAARSAAWSAAWSAARSAAESAERSAAESAARSAARSAAESAARSAAWSALAPTVAALQASAVDLIERMIAAGGAA